MRKIFTFHADNGHAWLRVTSSEALDVGLVAKSFSRYSYVKGNDFYLEEDCDAGLFMNAYQRKYGTLPELHCENYNGSSPIRNYRRIKESA
jgi:hypothetical protein